MAEKMQEFITECCQILRIDLTDNSKNFISYICDPAKARHVDQDLNVPLHSFLERYPDSWTFFDKESYVFNIVSAHHMPWHAVRSRINNSGVIHWPCNDDDSIVQELVDINALGGKWKKNTEYPFEYIQQCRNCFKHFHKLPNANQQALGGSPQGLIQRMEQWDPEVWRKLYHIYGPLVYSK
jgi:hypothetical protein